MGFRILPCKQPLHLQCFELGTSCEYRTEDSLWRQNQVLSARTIEGSLWGQADRNYNWVNFPLLELETTQESTLTKRYQNSLPGKHCCHSMIQIIVISPLIMFVLNHANIIYSYDELLKTQSYFMDKLHTWVGDTGYVPIIKWLHKG